MVARTFCLAVVVAVSMLGAAPARAQSPSANGLTMEWVLGDEGRSVASLPTHAWLSDGRLMLLDT
ncbi:MAG: hypothetical protein QOH49_2512 [Acidobacteriota bacterium]|jgi:hypothetical protein|nr:hypothetical protein [Acidobacteriota bacterium]